MPCLKPLLRCGLAFGLLLFPGYAQGGFSTADQAYAPAPASLPPDAPQAVTMQPPGGYVPPVTSVTPLAGNDEAYNISAVTVDVTAASAAAARDKAIFDGQRAALTQLLERLNAGKAVDPAKLNDNKMAALVKNFEITSEKASSVRYIATMNVSFKPLAVQGLLDKAGISYVANPSMPLVILPISESNGRAVLWEESTPWREALEALEHQPGAQPIVVPGGELNDIGAIDAKAALAGDAGALGALATLHSAVGVIVAQVNGDVVKLSPSQPLNIVLTRFDNMGQRMEGQNLIVPPSATMAAQMSDASARVQDFVLHKVLNTTAEAGKPTQASLQLYAPLTSLPELTRLRQRLGAISAIQHINIQSVTRDGADLVLDFNGDAMALQQNMAQQGLLMLQDPNGQWQIRSN